jgi:hypothetical protein
MAHYAKINDQNIVEQVIVISNEDELKDGVESEEQGIAFCKSLFGKDTNWVKTSYNSKIRGNYAGIGYTYNPEKDVFAPPKPYPSWILNDKAQWCPPIPYPDDGKMYAWKEELQSWLEIQMPANLENMNFAESFRNKNPEELVR